MLHLVRYYHPSCCYCWWTSSRSEKATTGFSKNQGKRNTQM